MTFTPEEIAAMAEEAGFSPTDMNDGRDERLARFAQRVADKAAAREREGCATLVQLGPPPVTGFGSRVEIGFGARTAYASAIRARGQKGGAL